MLAASWSASATLTAGQANCRQPGKSSIANAVTAASFMKFPQTSRCIAAHILVSLWLSLWSCSAFPINLAGSVDSAIIHEQTELDDEAALSSKAIRYALSELRLDALQGTRVSLLVDPLEFAVIGPCRAQAPPGPLRMGPGDARPKGAENCVHSRDRRTSLLKSLLTDYLTSAGIEVVASDHAAATRMYVTADVLAVDRVERNWLLYRQDDLLAEVGVELSVLDVKSGLKISSQVISARALQRQGHVLGFWPVRYLREVGPGRGLLVDFSNL